MLTIESQGDKVVGVESTLPDMRAIANETLRVKIAKEFFS